MHFFTFNGCNFERHPLCKKGYILNLLRYLGTSVEIENSPKISPMEMVVQAEIKKPAVLILHGAMSCGTDWLLDSPEKTLPGKLSAAGFDCWLANFRGTKLSNTHVSLNPNSREYWDFSADEISEEVPLMIDYILKMTRLESIYIVGVSLGCTVTFMALSQWPEYNSKIKLIVALAPGCYEKQIRSKSMTALILLGNSVSNWKFIYQRPMGNITIMDFAKCIFYWKRKQIAIWIWKIIQNRMTGGSNDKWTEAQQISIAETVPSAASIKTMCHLAQLLTTGAFRAYDYGSSENLKKYGKSTPLDYDLKAVSAPVATFSSVGDTTVTCQDVERLERELPNVVSSITIPNPDFKHMHFCIGKDADVLVFDRVIDLFRNAEGQKGKEKASVESLPGTSLSKP